MPAALFEDPSVVEVFQQRSGYPLGPEDLLLYVLSWQGSGQSGTRRTYPNPSLLLSAAPSRLRVIFAPLDLPDNSTAVGILRLVEGFSIPLAFLSERIQSVPHSFGTRTSPDGAECSWFHYLCKNITVERDRSDPRKVTIRNPVVRSDTKAQSQSDYSWLRSAYFLRVEPNRHQSRSPGAVTLLCFGAPTSLQHRFERILNHPDWEDAIRDPYILLDIVFDELYRQLDGIVLSLSEVFGGMESVRIFSYRFVPF
jgi:hypothetical protein